MHVYIKELYSVPGKNGPGENRTPVQNTFMHNVYNHFCLRMQHLLVKYSVGRIGHPITQKLVWLGPPFKRPCILFYTWLDKNVGDLSAASTTCIVCTHPLCRKSDERLSTMLQEQAVPEEQLCEYCELGIQLR